MFLSVLLCIIQKLCVDKKWIPPGLSIETLRYYNMRYLVRQLDMLMAKAKQTIARNLIFNLVVGKG